MMMRMEQKIEGKILVRWKHHPVQMIRKMTNSLLNAKEVSKMLKCSLPLVYRMADRGQLPCVRWECPGQGNTRPRTMVRFTLEDVRGFIERHYQK
jgi:predicted DNA-binding transcriptional regulator AlpA